MKKHETAGVFGEPEIPAAVVCRKINRMIGREKYGIILKRSIIFRADKKEQF